LRLHRADRDMASSARIPQRRMLEVLSVVRSQPARRRSLLRGQFPRHALLSWLTSTVVHAALVIILALILEPWRLRLDPPSLVAHQGEETTLATLLPTERVAPLDAESLSTLPSSPLEIRSPELSR